MSENSAAGGVTIVHDRLERGRHPILQAIDQSKRDVLLAIREDQATPEEVMEQTYRTLATQDLSFGEYLQVQGAQNAAAWVMGNLRRI